MSSRRLSVLALLFAAALAARLLWAAPAPPGPVAAVTVPRQLGPWQGRDLPLPAPVREALPGARVLFREYRRAGRSPVFLTLVRGRQVASFHRPTFCYEGEGWSVVAAGSRQLPVQGRAVPVQTVAAQKERERQLMVYWYTCAGQPAASKTQQQVLMLRERLRGKPALGGMVRLAAGFDEAPAQAEAAIGDLLRYAYPALPPDLR